MGVRESNTSPTTSPRDPRESREDRHKEGNGENEPSGRKSTSLNGHVACEASMTSLTAYNSNNSRSMGQFDVERDELNRNLKLLNATLLQALSSKPIVDHLESGPSYNRLISNSSGNPTRQTSPCDASTSPKPKIVSDVNASPECDPVGAGAKSASKRPKSAVSASISEESCEGDTRIDVRNGDHHGDGTPKAPPGTSKVLFFGRSKGPPQSSRPAFFTSPSGRRSGSSSEGESREREI